MPLELSEVVNDLAHITVPVGRDDLKVSYRPNSITTKTLSKALAGNKTDEFLKMCCDLIVDWDLLTGGQKVPITTQSLDDVPILILKAIFNEIVKNTTGDSGEA